MDTQTTEMTINEKARAILSDFGFSQYCELRRLEDDDSFLWRLTKALSESIDRALPALQPPIDETFGWDRMTWPEREYSRHFFYNEYESLIIPLFREGWSVRRVHRQLVSMLRALIALDPERLSEFAVVIPSEEAALVDERAASAADLVSSERYRLAPTSISGHMFRYGLYLGMAMARNGGMNEGELQDLAARIAEEIGAKDPLDRPDYAMDPRVAEEIVRMRAERDKKSEA